MTDLMSGILAWYCRQFHPRRWPVEWSLLVPAVHEAAAGAVGGEGVTMEHRDPVCAHCHHFRSAHSVGLFGPQCSGKFWVQLDDEGADKPCQCTGFVE